MSRRKKASKGRKPDLPSHIYVDSAAAWRGCVRRLQQEPRIAIDLEANSMYAYQEEICLIQISVPDQDYIVDPLGDFQLDPLGEIVMDRDVEKIFHAAEYDLILMKRQFNWTLNNLFDTMWAARILGYERVGLANILADIRGVKLDKRFQRANWCRRPLSEAQLLYAQADTHYLFGLRDHFAAELREQGRMKEAQEIFAEQTKVTIPENGFDPDSFWSINGANRLSGQGKAILKALTIYRDEVARRRNRPHFKVFQDRTLMELARTAPEDRHSLAQVHGMTEGQIGRYGSDILRIIAENRRAAAPRRPRRPPRPPDEVLNRYDRLRSWRKERGLERGVESDVILSRDALWAIARANPTTERELATVDGLGPWRLATYGDEILELLTK